MPDKSYRRVPTKHALIRRMIAIIARQVELMEQRLDIGAPPRARRKRRRRPALHAADD